MGFADRRCVGCAATVSFALLAMISCSSQVAPVIADASQPVEAALPDLGPDQSTGCTAGVDLAPLTLAADYCVVRRLPFRWAVPTAISRGDDGIWAYTGTFIPAHGVFLGEVLQWPFDYQTKQFGESTKLFGFTQGSSVAVSPLPFLAQPASKSSAVVGYMLPGGWGGRLFWGKEEPPAPEKLDVPPGAIDAVFFDEHKLLVSGSGLLTTSAGTPGVYLHTLGGEPRLLIGGLGDGPRQLALGEQTLFVSAADGDDEKVFAFGRAEVEAALNAKKTLGAADADVVRSGDAAFDLATLGDDLLLLRRPAAGDFESLDRLPISVSGDEVTATAAPHAVIERGFSSGSVECMAAAGDRIAIFMTYGIKEVAAAELQRR